MSIAQLRTKLKAFFTSEAAPTLLLGAEAGGPRVLQPYLTMKSAFEADDEALKQAVQQTLNAIAEALPANDQDRRSAPNTVITDYIDVNLRRIIHETGMAGSFNFPVYTGPNIPQQRSGGRY